MGTLIHNRLEWVCLRSVQRFPALLATVSCAVCIIILRSVHRFIPSAFRRDASGISPKSQWNIAEKPVVYRREAGGISPKSRWYIAKKPVAFRRKATMVLSGADHEAMRLFNSSFGSEVIPCRGGPCARPQPFLGKVIFWLRKYTPET